jgi:tetratricopeptide (TPR) repeat protein
MFRSVLIAALSLFLALPIIRAQDGKTSISDIEALIRSRQYDQALSALRVELRGDPANFRLWTLEGVCFAIQGKDSEALTAFNRAIRISPGYAPALKGEIQILYKTADKRAIPLLERLLRSDANDTTAHEMLAMLDKHGGDCRAAVSQFQPIQDAIANHPDSLEAYGYCLVQLNRASEAVPVFRQLVPLLPGRTYPSYDLAVLLVSTKDNDEAVKVLEPLLTPSQTDPDVFSLASQAYEATGNTPRAVQLQRQAIVLDPSDPSNYIAFAVLCLNHDSFQVGIDMLNAGLKHIPGDASLYLSRGVLYVQLGEFDNAEADFTKAEELNASQNLGAYAGDLAFLEANNPAKALEQVRGQLHAHPDNSLLRLLLVQLLMSGAPAPESAAFKEAMQNALTIARRKPDLAGVHDQLAGMYMSLKQYDRAIGECRLALQYDASDETAMYHLVMSLRHNGESNEELQPLVKRLSEMHRATMQRETELKRYRLVEAEAPPQTGSSH